MRPSRYISTGTHMTSETEAARTGPKAGGVLGLRRGGKYKPLSLTQRPSSIDNTWQRKNYFSLTESHWVYKPHLRAGPMPSSIWPHNMVFLEIFCCCCWKMLYPGFSSSPLQVFVYTVWFLILCFYEYFVYRSICMCFIFDSFLLFVIVLFWFVCFVFVCFSCLFCNERERNNTDVGRKGGEVGKS